MFKSVVEMYGIPQEVTRQNKVELELKDDAGLKDIIAGLRQKIPAMDGMVFQRGQDRLTDYYSLIVNGQFQPADSNVRIGKDDRIVLVLLAIGG
jgi:hypothetical protein